MDFSCFAILYQPMNKIALALFLYTQVVVVQGQAIIFQNCYNTFREIVNGSLTLGTINNETIWHSGFIYTGTFTGLHSDSLRSQVITPTYLGCKAICGPGAHLNAPITALSVVTTWVFPLAIILSLPFESLHKGRFKGTLTATLNWIGTPQSSLTATIYNFVQITKCRRGSKDCNNDPRWTDLYYVLSVFNQFDGPESGPKQDRFVATLIYGLYRTVSNHNEESATSEEVILTREILSELAYQLRMLRRRAVIPTMASLATFMAAFVFSVVQTFADLGDNASVEPLGLGLLFGWLPVLVIFAIVDRNPVSALRSSELMSRWLYNADAIRTHFHGSHIIISSSNGTNKDKKDSIQPIDSHQTPRSHDIDWWRANLPRGQYADIRGRGAASAFKVGDFIGQGRRMKYCGIVSAILKEAKRSHFDNNVTSYDVCATAVVKRLQGRRPVQWYAITMLSFFLVWIQISMAFMFAYQTPTVGIGCWAGGYLVFGLLSSVSWIVQLCLKWPGRRTRLACHGVNFLAVCWLITYTTLVLTGGINTCFCKTIFGKLYMNFETARFYLQFCHVRSYWIGATVIGGLVPVLAFFVAICGWLKCQHLWSANEGGPARLERSSARVDWGWLRYNSV